MATGTCRISFTSSRSRVTRGFHFAIGPRRGCVFSLAAIPIAIAAVIFGILSIAILMGALVLLALTLGIRWWWLRFRARGAANAGDVLDTAPALALPAPKNAPRLNGPMGSPQ
ncbi:MAG TPA: hypothetical protein VI485_29835 [Vicinamibacterales bacterium]|nr:hypothetical protein [Vicinamibacterales bacterium]